ncbi:hypothetical protein SAMN04487830_11616 [Pseudobutyrivibrio sp. OR37]|uniref:DUF6033 family protein n=1 Tax=Pseudobutyrivibrio sp. OR37 TaxID=1798186 RepID=UPI0008E9EBE1|nr:DUF6033 family protein [Pseudobutyrivibrio sp. OR37]SFH98970.1 hypothetical protein SAMN04487830_11616 [Pseudobutyrivibrio sp. OR37]
MDKVSLNLNINQNFKDKNQNNDNPKAITNLKKNNNSDCKDYIVSISDDGNKRRVKADEYKKSGVTSRREMFEEQTVEEKRTKRYDFLGNIDLTETFRLDEPETYERVRELERIVAKGSYPVGYSWTEYTDEAKQADLEAFFLKKDWFERRCMVDGKFRNPVTGHYAAMEVIERTFSDSSHDTTLNFYGPSEKDQYRENMWRYSSKFNVLLSADMVKQLIDYENPVSHDLIEKIDDVITKMKDVEKKYEGDYLAVQFGAKFHQDGAVSYYASYARSGQKGRIEIEASSSEELLSKLNNGTE